MLDFAGYLDRIGLESSAVPTWTAIHRAHVTAIPFENLDSHRGIPVSLAQADLERKLVTQRRGGYCFEHNLLLASAIEHLGLRVEPMLARVRVGDAPADSRPAGHLVLRVTDGDGKVWLADVGFGLGTLLDPIPFQPDPDAVHEQSGWHFRLVEDHHDVVLQTLNSEGWSNVYGFVPHPAPRIDIEVNNWWICTNPASPFVSGLIAAVNHDDGRREAMVDWSGPLVVMTMSPRSSNTAPLHRTLIPAKLEQFGLPGFTLGRDGRVR
jgi:N-hydroxyarylamine O-acetyltransferase